MRRFTPVLVMTMACAGGSDQSVDSSAAAAVPQEVKIAAQDFVFEAPDTISAGMTTFRLTSTGEPHHVQLVQILEGKTYEDLVAAMREMKPGVVPPAWMRMVAGPQPPQGTEETNVTLSLDAGTYALVCFIEGPDRVPHLAKGMMQSLTVVPGSGPSAPAPNADVTVAITDYTWTFTPELTTGRHTLKFENHATQPHEAVVVRLLEGKATDDVMKWAETFAGAPPFTWGPGVSNFSPGAPVFVTGDFTPGDYLLLCFYPDAKDGKPHVMHGMMKPVKIA